MLRRDETVSLYEGVCLFAIAFLSHAFSESTPILVESLGSAAWMAQLISILFGFGYLGLFWLLFRRYEEMEFAAICDAVYGRVAAKVIQVLLLIHLYLFASSILNRCVETLQVYVYSEMSALTIDLLVLGAVAAIALYSIKGLSKIISVVLPILFLIVLFILLMSKEQYDPNLLHPLLGRGPEEIAQKSVFMTSKFNAILLMAVAGGAFPSKKHYRRAALIAIPVAGLLTFAETLCFCLAIPYSSADDIHIGLAGLAQGNWTGRYIQRLESVYLAANVVVNILLIGYIFLLIVKLYCRLFRIKTAHKRAVIVPLLAVALCLTRVLADNVFYRDAVRGYTRYYSVFFCVGVILLTLLVGFLRRQGRKGGKKLARAAAVTLVSCLCLGLLSGCSGVREPDAEIYPIVIGYDRGAREKYLITMKFMTEEKAGTKQEAPEEAREGGAGGGTLPGDVMAVEAPSLSEGLHLVNSLMPRSVSLLHIRLLVISEELAREGVGELVTPIIRSNQFKPTMPIVVSRCPAYDLVTGKDPVLTSSVQADTELMLETVEQSTSYLGVTLSQFLYRYDSPYGDAMAIYANVNRGDYEAESSQGTDGENGEGGDSLYDIFSRAPSTHAEGYLAGQLPVMGNRDQELAGMAVFRGQRMVGTLDTVDCQALALLNDKLLDTEILFPDPHEPEKYYVTLNLRRVQAVNLSSQVDGQGQAHIQIDVSYKGLVGISQNPDIDYVADTAQRAALRRHCEDLMTRRCRELMERLQREYRADVLQLGRHVAGNFSTIPEWEAYGWAERFPEAVVDIRFTIQM